MGLEDGPCISSEGGARVWRMLPPLAVTQYARYGGQRAGTSLDALIKQGLHENAM